MKFTRIESDTSEKIEVEIPLDVELITDFEKEEEKGLYSMYYNLFTGEVLHNAFPYPVTRIFICMSLTCENCYAYGVVSVENRYYDNFEGKKKELSGGTYFGEIAFQIELNEEEKRKFLLWLIRQNER